MSKFSPERIGGLGYGKKELILMGSFDGKQINVDQEFRLHSDPRYGNCFTFNWNAIRNKTMSRAGPSYGKFSFVFFKNFIVIICQEKMITSLSLNDNLSNRCSELNRKHVAQFSGKFGHFLKW